METAAYTALAMTGITGFVAYLDQWYARAIPSIPERSSAAAKSTQSTTLSDDRASIG